MPGSASHQAVLPRVIPVSQTRWETHWDAGRGCPRPGLAGHGGRGWGQGQGLCFPSWLCFPMAPLMKPHVAKQPQPTQKQAF